MVWVSPLARSHEQGAFSGRVCLRFISGQAPDSFPIIDFRHNYLIGAIDSGKWIEPTDATNSVKPGAKLHVYGLTGDVGTAQVVKVDTDHEPCPDQPVVKLRAAKMRSGEIAFSANRNPLP
jgi:hypothetical protein